MLIVHPDVVISRTNDSLIVEDNNIELTFHGESADAAAAVLRSAPNCRTLSDLSSQVQLSLGVVKQICSALEEEYLLLDLSNAGKLSKRSLMTKIREASVFWNKHIMSQTFPRRLFAGEATSNEVLGWGIEHYFFVRAANEYMALGASRTDGSTNHLAELWSHYAEEALHDEIFLRGLTGCGLDQQEIVHRSPIPSTYALTNFLFEKSIESALAYASVFCVMQAKSTPMTREAIEDKYNNMRFHYDFAYPLFNAFEEHDKIDADLNHATLTLEPIIEMLRPLSENQVKTIFDTIEQTANHFIIFFEGIPKHYKTTRSVNYRQQPNAVAAALLEQ